jgi:hypothetical protein
VGCGFFLVGAAALKTLELVVDPSAAALNSLGPILLPVEIGTELALGLLL